MSLQDSPAGEADWLHLNPSARRWTSSVTANPVQVEAFHHCLPEFNETPLVSLPAVASELGLARVLVKDESRRLGLPAFKILGAAWAVYRAAAARIRLPPTVSLRLVTCADGNWGRAVARMASYLDLPGAYLCADEHGSDHPRPHIKSEGAEVCVVDQDCDGRSRSERRTIGYGHVVAWLRGDANLRSRRLLYDAPGN